MNPNQNLEVIPFTQETKANVSVPGSKSISNRALILAALSNATIKLKGMLKSEDVDLMIKALVSLGVEIKGFEDGEDFTVRGCGGKLPVKKQEIYVGNAGTVARFLTALLAIQDSAEYTLDGCEAMRKRPMVELLETLKELGCTFKFLEEPGCFPFVMQTSSLSIDNWKVDATKSSQVLSALLMIAPAVNKKTRINYFGGTVSEPFVDLTMGMMKDFSSRQTGMFELSEHEIFVDGLEYTSDDLTYEVEPDATAASYFLTLPLITGGFCFLPGISKVMNQGDSAYSDVLNSVGVITKEHENGLEAIATKVVKGGDFDFNSISDTFLSLAAVSPLFKERIKISGIAHTRKQETDRVKAMATELQKLGQKVIETEDALEIFPNIDNLREKASKPLVIETYHDHRFAMSFAILGCFDLFGNGKPWLQIHNAQCCAKTFPDFFEKLEQVRQDSHK
jgi:3-phosphoshikimate 1-carboxyvinyltransferase